MCVWTQSQEDCDVCMTFLSASSTPEHRDLHTSKGILGSKGTFKHDLVMTGKRKRESSETERQGDLDMTGNRKRGSKETEHLVTIGKRKRDYEESAGRSKKHQG